MDVDVETAKYCYTCLSSDTSLISLFSSGMDIILQCTLNILPSFDNTFNWICYKCRALLRNFEKFRSSCLQTDSFIKKYITDPNEYVNTLKGKNDYFNLATSNIFYIDVLSDISCTKQNNYFHINSSESIENNMGNSIFDQNEYSEDFDNKTPLIKNEPDHNKGFECIFSESSTKQIKLKKKKHKRDNHHISEDKIINESIETDSINGLNKKNRSKTISNRLSMKKSKLLKVYLTEDEQKSERQKRMNEEKYLNAPFKCELCVIPFRREFTLENHMEKHREDRGPYLCAICQQRFSNERQFKMHTSIHSVRLVCYACGAQLRDRGQLADHLARHAGRKYPCKMCNSTFICRTTLNNHVRVKHKDCEYKCEFCSKVFKVKERLKEHESRHSKSPAYSCNVCNKRFYSTANLANHKATHSTMRHYYCVECDLYFKSASILKNHLEKSRKHIDPSLLQYPCDRCNKRFRTSDLLAHHVDATHLKRKKFSCEICSASYASHQGLNFHRRLAHQGFRLPKSHTCTICERSFTAKALLTNHLRVHTGEKPFECSECFRKFSQKSSLRTHIKLVHLKLKRVVKKKLKTKVQETAENDSATDMCVDKIDILNLYPEDAKNWECKVTDDSHVQEEIIEGVCDISVPINIEHAFISGS